LISGIAAVGPSGASAARAGAQLTVIASRTHESVAEIFVVDPHARLLSAVRGATRLGGAEVVAWSPDGREYAFVAFGIDLPRLMVAGVGASEARLLDTPSWRDFPVFAPDGDVVSATTELYDRSPGPDYEPAGTFGTILSALPVDGSEARRMATFGPGVSVDPYSSDSEGTITATASTQQGQGIVILRPGKATLRWVLGPGAYEVTSPAISPDGSEVVYLRDQLSGQFPRSTRIRSTKVISVPTRGGRPKVLATIRGGARWLSWDPSGSRLSFTALEPGKTSETGRPGPHSALMEMNPDGSCLTTVYVAKAGGAVWGAAWRPRPGPAIGPISC
jgi:Tol biopolymer transport system component